MIICGTGGKPELLAIDMIMIIKDRHQLVAHTVSIRKPSQSVSAIQYMYSGQENSGFWREREIAQVLKVGAAEIERRRYRQICWRRGCLFQRVCSGPDR
jgi:hypothetical protein